MSILAHIADALTLLGGTADLASDPRLSTVESLLEAHGLKLAVVPEDSSAVRLTSRMLVLAAIRRATDAGEPTVGIQNRIAALVGVDKSAIARVLGTGTELASTGRVALEEHLRDQAAHPLPAVHKRWLTGRDRK